MTITSKNNPILPKTWVSFSVFISFQWYIRRYCFLQPCLCIQFQFNTDIIVIQPGDFIGHPMKLLACPKKSPKKVKSRLTYKQVLGKAQPWIYLKRAFLGNCIPCLQSRQKSKNGIFSETLHIYLYELFFCLIINYQWLLLVIFFRARRHSAFCEGCYRFPRRCPGQG